MAYRVDTIPLWLRPFFLLWAYGAALLMLAALKLCRHLTSVKFQSKSGKLPPVAIYAIWHEDLLLYFSSEGKYQKPYFWMNHPAWYMKPIHLLLYWKGVSGIALGSTGHGGRGALAEVIEKLKEGYNTLVAIDGPAGPPKKAKIGAIEMSAQTGLPIIPITYQTTKEFRWGGWDRKRQPYYFTSWTVTFENPIFADPQNLESSRLELERG